MIKVGLVVAPDPIVHHLEVLAIWMLHVQTREHGDPVVQLPHGGLCCALQPCTTAPRHVNT